MMKASRSERLSTNLVGRTVRLVTDDDARAAATRQGNLDPATIAGVTAEQWIPMLAGLRGLAVRRGEVIAVHLTTYSELMYTIDFGGELRDVPAACFILEPRN